MTARAPSRRALRSGALAPVAGPGLEGVQASANGGGSRPGQPADDVLPGGDQGASPGHRAQGQVESPGQQRSAGAEGDRGDAHQDLVEQPGVGELPGEVAPTDDPDVLAAGGGRGIAMNATDIATDKPDVRALDLGE